MLCLDCLDTVVYNVYVNVSKSIFLMTDSTKVPVLQELEYLSCICGFVRSKQERLLCE